MTVAITEPTKSRAIAQTTATMIIPGAVPSTMRSTPRSNANPMPTAPKAITAVPMSETSAE